MRPAPLYAALITACGLLVSASVASTGTTVAGVVDTRPTHPEDLSEMMLANSTLAMREQGGRGQILDGAFASAQAQDQQLVAASAAGASVGNWVPAGKTPLIANEPGYTSVNGLGLANLSGRIEDFAIDSRNNKHWYAAVATGGVYETNNSGTSWHSIGDNLPTQTSGALVFSRAHNGTLIDGTGDPAYGGSSISGLGAYWTRDNGKHWVKSKGVPDGTITFSGAIDPKVPTTVYLATGKGLYRSTDTGKTFKNVVLPTTCTDVHKPICFFANMVTDVVINSQGKVLAAVGWRAGNKLNAQGLPQAPRNGLYSSPSGKPGTFTFLGGPIGFTSQASIGRVSLGNATGPGQDANYVFAVVQDSKKFNKQATLLGIPETDLQAKNVPSNTVLDGIYGSADFGQSWTKLADASQLLLPTGGTALLGPGAATYAPGVQSWYNSWIQVDPTSTGPLGAPTRIAFGLEEVWENDGPLVIVPAAASGAGAPLNPLRSQTSVTTPGTTPMKVIGRYFAGGSCAGLNFSGIVEGGLPICPTSRGLVKSNTTHPDQHAGKFLSTGQGDVTLLVGNDGGAYKQTVPSGGDFTNSGWGLGINNGLHTLIPYDAAISNDGTIWAGLQDNGTVKITPSGRQIETYGGDGFFVAVDPESSNIAWEEYVGGATRVTTDGGKTWTSNGPTMTGALFATPFVMDRTDPDHLVIGGREVFETLSGPRTSSTSWKKVFDLGTRTKPGDANASAGTGDPVNALSAVDTRGNATYVGYCGYCDIVTGGVPFHSGLATNVGRGGTGESGTTANWHIAKAIGLPQRYLTSVTIDPKNAKTVYVTLGGYGRRWIPPGSLGDDISKIGTGHIFVSHDAGEHFTNLSGNLPDAPANDTILHHGDLIAATELGVYVLPGGKGSKWQKLGAGLPNVPTFQINGSPRSADEFVAATYGRGVYTIKLRPVSVATITPAAAASGSGGAAASGSNASAGSSAAFNPAANPASARMSLGDGLLLALAALGLIAGISVTIRRTRARRG